MKKSIFPFIVFIFAIVIAFSLIACGSGNDDNSQNNTPTLRFTTLDLQGTWSLHGVSTGLTRATNKGSYHGEMLMSNSGNILSGSVNIQGIVADPNLSGNIAIDESGFIDGTIVTNHGFSFFLDSGLMDNSKTSMVFIDFTNNAAMPFDLAVLIKEGGVFLPADIHGNWHMFGLCSKAGADADFGSIDGNLTINAAGTPSGTFNLAGTAHTITTGNFSLSTSGFIETGNTLVAGSTWTISSGKLDPSKTFGVFTSQTGITPDLDLVVMIKESSLVLSTSDLAGTWYIHGATAGEAAGDDTIVGTIIIGSTGTVTGGSVTLPNDTERAIGSGSFSLTANGSLTGSFTLDITLETITISAGQGRMDQSKQKIAFTDTTNKRLYILYK